MTTETNLRTEMNGPNLFNHLRENNPKMLFAIYKDDSAIAVYADGRWVPIAGKAIDGNWYKHTGEVLANGVPLHNQNDWRTEV